MKKKWVDEQGEPFPPEEAVCGWWNYSVVYEPEIVTLCAISNDGANLLCDDLYGGCNYIVPLVNFVPCNKTTKDLISAWNAEWVETAAVTALRGIYWARIQQLGVYVSRGSVDALTKEQFAYLKEIIDTASEMEDGVENTKAFENLVLKVFKEKK